MKSIYISFLVLVLMIADSQCLECYVCNQQELISNVTKWPCFSPMKNDLNTTDCSPAYLKNQKQIDVSDAPLACFMMQYSIDGQQVLESGCGEKSGQEAICQDFQNKKDAKVDFCFTCSEDKCNVAVETELANKLPNLRSKVAVALYYESLCPHARDFITDQLYPALSTNLGKYINLTLYPYGKAETTEQPDNTYSFTCQHGPNECAGNKYHACALASINNGKATEGLSYNNDAMKYVNCLAKTVSGNNVQPNDCAIHAGGFTDDIKRCATGQEGDKLLAKHGNSTDELEKPLKRCPTITLDDEIIRDAEMHFMRELCKKFRGPKPAECAKSGANAASAAYGILTVVVAIMFM